MYIRRPAHPSAGRSVVQSVKSASPVSQRSQSVHPSAKAVHPSVSPSIRRSHRCSVSQISEPSQCSQVSQSIRQSVNPPPVSPPIRRPADPSSSQSNQYAQQSVSQSISEATSSSKTVSPSVHPSVGQSIRQPVSPVTQSFHWPANKIDS